MFPFSLEWGREYDISVLSNPMGSCWLDLYIWRQMEWGRVLQWTRHGPGFALVARVRGIGKAELHVQAQGDESCGFALHVAVQPSGILAKYILPPVVLLTCVSMFIVMTFICCFKPGCPWYRWCGRGFPFTVRGHDWIQLEEEFELHEEQGSGASVSGGRICIGCVESPVQVACIPCGHVSLCESCSRIGQANEISKCPICGESFRQLLRIYSI